MLLRLALLGITNAFALLRLLPGGDRDKDIEILSLRHQLAVLQRQLDGQQVRFALVDRAWLAGLLHPLPRPTLRRLRLLVRPDTVLKWHRDLIARRHAAVSRPRRRGRPRTLRSIRALVLRLASENGSWGYRRVHGELLTLGIKVAPSTVWEILHEAGIDPAPRPGRHHLDGLPALPSPGAAGRGLHRDRDTDRSPDVHTDGDRTRQPPDPGPGRHGAPDRRLGRPGRTQPGDGSRRPLRQNQVPDPGSGRQVPRHVRRDPRRRRYQGRAQRYPGAPDERDHGTLGADLPPRTAGPHADLEPAASAACAAGVRAVLQPTPTASGDRERPAAQTAARTDHRPGLPRSAQHSPA